MIKFILRFVSKKKLIELGVLLINKGIAKGIDKLDDMKINGKDIKREHLEQLEKMTRHYLKK